MAQSREQLTMDMSKSDNSIFKRPSGCYLSRPKILVLTALALAGAVAVAVITYHAVKCDGAGDETDASGDSTGVHKVKDVRLPKTLKPVYYKLNLMPWIEEEKNFTLEGRAWIDMLCEEETNKITLHLKNITVDESSVSVMSISQPEVNPLKSRSDTGKPLKIKSHVYDEARDFYNVTVKESLQVGKFYRIYMKYTGVLADDLAGFYRSSYQDMETNETRWLGITQFQPTDARRAFPCFDEPSLKAKFEVSIAHKDNLKALSNMDLASTEPVEGMEGWTWDHFNVSIPMSTYLVAFMVSDFESRESDRSLSEPIFKVWARKDAIDQAEYAKDIGPKILTYFETYYNLKFPLPKVDMVALPDFNAGAMENFGLITYRETAMLYDPKVSSDVNKLRVATVISHELAHQWFGNLVTPSWWNDLWLNEGFASYVEYIGVDHVEPAWKTMEQFVVDEVQRVFALDALESSHPISVPVAHPDEINEIFDRISYSKGASIIRMMNHFLTEPTFKTGLSNYLMKWTYNSTVQEDLWSALSDQAHIDDTMDKSMNVKQVMDTWTLKKGFPVIDVKRNYDANEATFSQKKFLLAKNESQEKEYESYKWWVPLNYASTKFNSKFSDTSAFFWLKDDANSLTKSVNATKDDWIIVNVQQTGYYRVNYDMQNWQLIINQLNENGSAINTVNRAQLLDDVLNLARASLLPYDLAFNVTQFLKHDDEYLPWESFLNAFGYISTMLKKTSSYGNFKTYMKDLLEEQYQRVKFEERENESVPERFHRINILRWACFMGHQGCINTAKRLFKEWMGKDDPNNDNPIPTNLRRIAYCHAIKYGGEEEWNFAWQRYLEANVASEKVTILSTLTCSMETWILNRYLNWSVTLGSGIRKQDGPIVLRGIASNDVGNYLAFNYIRDKWSHIRKYFGAGFFSIGGIIKSVANRLNTPFELAELQRFKTTYLKELGSAQRSVEQAIEAVEANVKWMDENSPIISTWLEKTTRGMNEINN